MTLINIILSFFTKKLFSKLWDAILWIFSIIKSICIWLYNHPRTSAVLALVIVVGWGIYKYVDVYKQNETNKTSLTSANTKITELETSLDNTVAECAKRIDAINKIHNSDLKAQKQLQTKCVDDYRFAKLQKEKPTLVTKLLNNNAKCIVDHVGQIDGQCVAGKWKKN